MLHVAVAAAAKSLLSRPILCDPMDSNPPGSSVHGILQTRTPEWVANTLSHTCYLEHIYNIYMTYCIAQRTLLNTLNSHLYALKHPLFIYLFVRLINIKLNNYLMPSYVLKIY